MSDFKSQQELMLYLSSDEDNRVIHRASGYVYNFFSGKLMYLDKYYTGTKSLESTENFSLYSSFSKYTKPCWEEAINEKPIFAFYRDNKEMDWSLAPTVFVKHVKNNDYPFRTEGTRYRYIKPATKEEIEVYINNIPEV